MTNKTVVNAKELDQRLINLLGNDKIMLDKAMYVLKGIEQQHFVRLSYEELMGDETRIDSLLRWAGASPKTLSWRSEAVAGRCQHGCSKTTPDDLREVVENYEEVESWIESNYPCLLHQLHETARDVVQKPVELSCGDIFKDRIEDYISARNAKKDRFFNTLL